MHSKGSFRKLLAFSIIATLTLPNGAYAEEKKPEPAGVEAKSAEIAKLEREIEELENQLDAEEDKRSPNEATIAAIQQKIWDKESERNNLRGDVKSFRKRYNRIVKIEKKIADLEKENQKLSGEKKRGSVSEDAAEIDEKIKINQDEITRLKGKVARKSKRNERRNDEAMYARCKGDQYRDPKTNECRVCTKAEKVGGVNKTDCVPLTAEDCKKGEIFDAKLGCSAECKTGETRDPASGACKPGDRSTGEVATTDKRKVAACWGETPKEPTAKIYALFPLSQTKLKLKDSNGSTPNGTVAENRAREYFEKQVAKVDQALGENGRITKVYASSSVSKVPFMKDGKKKKNSELAIARSQDSIDALFAQLGIGHDRKESSGRDPRPEGFPKPELKNRNKESAEPKVNGPEWKPGDVEALSKREVTKQGVKAAAKEIFSGKYGFSPVKGATLEETEANLWECCSSDQAALKYQPYQYTQILVFAPKFKGVSPEGKKKGEVEDPACTLGALKGDVDPTKVTTKAAKKEEPRTETGMIPGCVPDADNDCQARETQEAK